MWRRLCRSRGDELASALGRAASATERTVLEPESPRQAPTGDPGPHILPSSAPYRSHMPSKAPVVHAEHTHAYTLSADLPAGVRMSTTLPEEPEITTGGPEAQSAPPQAPHRRNSFSMFRDRLPSLGRASSRSSLYSASTDAAGSTWGHMSSGRGRNRYPTFGAEPPAPTHNRNHTPSHRFAPFSVNHLLKPFRRPKSRPQTPKAPPSDDRTHIHGQKVQICESKKHEHKMCPCPSPTHPELQRERVVVSATGEHFACVGSDGRASIWDNYTATRVGLTGKWLKETAVFDLAWSPYGSCLATASADGVVRVWDARHRALWHVLTGHTRAVTCVAWSPDGHTLATGAADNTVRLWDMHSGALIYSFRGHRDVVSTISWSPDGQALASGSWDTDVRVWDTATGNLIHLLDVENAKYEKPDANMAGAEEVHTWHPSWVWHVSWSPGGNTLAIAAEDCTVKLYSRKTGKVRRVLGGDFFFFFAADWSPDGKTLALCSDNKRKSAKIWYNRSGTLALALKGHTDLITTLKFSPDGDTLVTGSHDGTTRLWNSETGLCIRVLKGHSGPVKSVAWHPSGREVFTASEDGTVRIYHFKNC